MNDDAPSTDWHVFIIAYLKADAHCSVQRDVGTHQDSLSLLQHEALRCLNAYRTQSQCGSCRASGELGELEACTKEGCTTA